MAAVAAGVAAKYQIPGCSGFSAPAWGPGGQEPCSAAGKKVVRCPQGGQMSPGPCIKWQPQVTSPLCHPGWERLWHHWLSLLPPSSVRGLRLFPVPPRSPHVGRSCARPCHPPCVALSLLPGTEGPTGARQVGQDVLLRALCWGCRGAAPAPNPAEDTGNQQWPEQSQPGGSGESSAV